MIEFSQRAETEIRKLLHLHPDVQRCGAVLSSYFQPGAGLFDTRRIDVVVDRYYPACAPQAYVRPYEDISGQVTRYHIYDDGGICYMHTDQWNPLIHNLAFVFSQSKMIVARSIALKAKGTWNETMSILNQLPY